MIQQSQFPLKETKRIGFTSPYTPTPNSDPMCADLFSPEKEIEKRESGACKTPLNSHPQYDL